MFLLLRQAEALAKDGGDGGVGTSSKNGLPNNTTSLVILKV